MRFEIKAFTDLLSKIVDNRGRTCPTADWGLPLIATNCVKNDRLYPALEKIRYVDQQTAETWFRGHPEPGDLIFVCKGTPGQVCLAPDPVGFCIAQDMVAIRADPKKVHPPYLFALLRSAEVQAQIVNMHVGTLIPHFKKGDFDKLMLPVPPRSAQHAIGDAYLALSSKIECNSQVNLALEAMARALFHSWFVDFDPVKRRSHGGESRPEDSCFPDSFEDSEMGKIPSGWRVGSVYEIAEVNYGAPFSSKHFNTNREGKPLVRIRDLPKESPGIWTPEVHPKGYTVRPGDIVVGMDGEFRAYLWGGDEAWLNQRVCVFSPRSGFSAAFVRNSIMAPLAHVEATETATTVIHLGKNDIDRFLIVMPPREVIEAFTRLCQPWYDQIVANKQQSRTLAALRDTLLPKLLSGDVQAA